MDSDLLKQARAYAKRAGMSWDDLAEQALRSHLEQVDPEGAAALAVPGEQGERVHFVWVPDDVAQAEGDQERHWQR